MAQNRMIHTHKELGLLVDILNEILSLTTNEVFFSLDSVNSKLFVRAVQYQSPLLRVYANMSNQY